MPESRVPESRAPESRVGESPADQYVDSPPELAIARDLVRRGIPAAPILIAVCALIWGVDGALSSAYGVALVLVNFVIAAFILAWAARISLTALMAASLGGFVLRMGLIVVAVLLVKDAGWVSLPALCLTILVTHLGLLAWETRYVSASLAFPALKPHRERS
jgi:hypothetical protein